MWPLPFFKDQTGTATGISMLRMLMLTTSGQLEINRSCTIKTSRQIAGFKLCTYNGRVRPGSSRPTGGSIYDCIDHFCKWKIKRCPTKQRVSNCEVLCNPFSQFKSRLTIPVFFMADVSELRMELIFPRSTFSRLTPIGVKGAL